MKHKIFSILLVFSIIIVSISGCKKKRNVEEEEPTTVSLEEYNSLLERYDQIKNELAIYDESYKTSKAFRKKSVLNAGIMEFNKVKDKIVLDGKLTTDEYFDPGANNSLIKLGNNIEIDAANWTVRTRSDNIDFSINQHAYGCIYTKQFVSDYWDSGSTLYDYIKPYLDENSLTLSSKKDIFLSTTFVGQEGSANILIADTTKYNGDMTVSASQIIDVDSLRDYGLDQESELNIKVALGEEVDKKAKVRIGMLNVNNLILCYEFISLDDTGDNYINSLIRGIKIKGSNLHLD